MESNSRKKRTFKGGDEAGEGLWAISYADLLMVMMSFFIVFFNIEESTEVESSLLNNIALTLQNEQNIYKKDPKGEEIFKEEKLVEVGAPTVKEGIINFFAGPEEVAPTVKKRVISLQEKNASDLITISDLSNTAYTDNLQKSLMSQSLPEAGLQSINRGIMIDFSDNNFELGSYEITSKTAKEIDQVLERLVPHRKQLNLVFIGHSDQVPMSEKREVVKTNLVLSTLRAASAVEYAIKRGFDPIWVSAQGVGQYSRQSRSLSLRVVVR